MGMTATGILIYKQRGFGPHSPFLNGKLGS